jgi:glycosyltransferase involved in cell wall biosynthesis
MLLQNSSYPTDGRVLREATALTEVGYQVTVVCPRAPGQPWRERLDGVRLVRFPTTSSAGGAAGFVLEYVIAAVALLALSLEQLARRGFDVVHCHNPPDFLVAIAALFRPLGVRLVFDQHDLSPELFTARFGRRSSPRVRRALERLEIASWRLADLVITSNESQRQVGLSRSGVPADRAVVVRNGPDWRITRAAPVNGQARRPRAAAVVGYAGVVGPQDGAHHLVGALEHLVHDLGHGDVHCVVVGDGDALPRVRSQASAAGLDDRMTFPGWVPYEELVEWISALDVGVAPEPSNPYNDSCTSLKVMEYMALGRPIVAFDLPEHRRSAGEAAVYVPSGDERAMARAIAELIEDPARRRRMGEAGRHRVVERLAWTYEAPKLVAAYERMMAAPR